MGVGWGPYNPPILFGNLGPQGRPWPSTPVSSVFRPLVQCQHPVCLLHNGLSQGLDKRSGQSAHCHWAMQPTVIPLPEICLRPSGRTFEDQIALACPQALPADCVPPQSIFPCHMPLACLFPQALSSDPAKKIGVGILVGHETWAKCPVLPLTAL